MGTVKSVWHNEWGFKYWRQTGINEQNKKIAFQMKDTETMKHITKKSGTSYCDGTLPHTVIHRSTICDNKSTSVSQCELAPEENPSHPDRVVFQQKWTALPVLFLFHCHGISSLPSMNGKSTSVSLPWWRCRQFWAVNPINICCIHSLLKFTAKTQEMHKRRHGNVLPVPSQQIIRTGRRG